MSSPSLGLALVFLGVAIVMVGLLVWSGAFGWFGRLPGDIRIENETTRIYIPIVSCLLISVALILIVNVLRRFF